MDYDIIFVSGELFFDHPLSGVAILKRLLEKHGYSVGVIEMPKNEEDIRSLGAPRLFFGVSSGSIDSMVRNYTPLKKLRIDDENLNYNEAVPDRAIIVYSNWIRKHFKSSKLVIGGTEASLRRFTHYDYWDNKLRRSIILDSRADILVYGSAEKQILEIASRLKQGKDLFGIKGTCMVVKEKPGDAIELPSNEEVSISKERFCDMQNLLTNKKDLIQKQDNRFVIQYKAPIYTTKDLDEYYELPFTRKVPNHLQGFEFSVVTHRGCFGGCNFCSITLTQGDRIISRSEDSIIRELNGITKMSHFKGNIDDLGGPTANMYGMDCNLCDRFCLKCNNLKRGSKRWIELLRRARSIKGIKAVYIRSGLRYDLLDELELGELVKYHTLETLRIAPEHVNKDVLKLMNKDFGDIDDFLKKFNKIKGDKDLSFYFMTAHPGSRMEEAKELGKYLHGMDHAECVQVFTPTPMSVSTCMYHTGLDPATKKKIYVPYSYNEKKEQKRAVFIGIEGNENKNRRHVRNTGDQF